MTITYSNQKDKLKYFFTFTFTLLLLTISNFGYSQRNKMRDKVESHKIAFITDNLSLTEIEAQKFWPIYNTFQGERKAIKKSVDRTQKENMTEKEAEDFLYSVLDAKSKEIDLQKKYITKLKSAIPVTKIAMLFRVEQDFKEEVISNIKERRRDRMNK